MRGGLSGATPGAKLVRPGPHKQLEVCRWLVLIRRSELAAKDSELLGLRREVAELRAAQERARLSGDELGSAQEESASLRRERNALQKQVRLAFGAVRCSLVAGCWLLMSATGHGAVMAVLSGAGG